jgi:hypothetical protein
LLGLRDAFLEVGKENGALLTEQIFFNSIFPEVMKAAACLDVDALSSTSMGGFPVTISTLFSLFSHLLLCPGLATGYMPGEPEQQELMKIFICPWTSRPKDARAPRCTHGLELLPLALHPYAESNLVTSLLHMKAKLQGIQVKHVWCALTGAKMREFVKQVILSPKDRPWSSDSYELFCDALAEEAVERECEEMVKQVLTMEQIQSEPSSGFRAGELLETKE